jgi:hypothetical protein
MKRRVERRYLSQLISGCGKAWCKNEFCKTARAKSGKGDAAMTAQTALPMVKPFMDTISNNSAPMYFCVDEGSQKRRILAELLGAEGVFNFEWCVAACEAEGGNLENARTWLQNWAPKK